jgi:SAM-dependent methyltransferase
MHPEVDTFIKITKARYPDMFNTKSVLEVGSQDINGSVRNHFHNCDYIGIDLGEAPGVDVVLDATDMKYWEEFDVVISSEMLEHCKEWDLALSNMYGALKPGGLFILTCAGPNRQEHGTNNHTPQDSKFTLEHYRNISIEDFISILPLDFFKESSLGLYRGDCDLYFYGIKKAS